ncbi:4Fe-4S binding protein [Sutterella sp.]|uniref:4Fe-4S binding protein n=1 Tax=Sutterella sp. TaxID=1981025 RepID=UPI0026E0687C|nr:4Fe-4S binding protein [Sutterella sp.]MDO5530896.1 4Fe-4S binding protein [Sutterella sp.]
MSVQRPMLARRRCLKSRHIGSGCSACVTICPAGALAIVEKRLRFNPARCAGCGACASVCPSDALLFPAISDDQLESAVRAAAQTGTVIFASAQAVNAPTEAIRLPSVVWLSLAWLLFAAAEGTKKLVLIGAGESAEAKLGPVFEARLRTARAILSELKSPMTIEHTVARAAVDAGRRALFSGWAKAAETPKAPEPPTESARLRAAKLAAEPQIRTPESRERLISALRRLRSQALQKPGVTAAPESPAAAAALALPSVEAIRCTACGICTAVCPTGALTSEKSHGSETMSVSAEKCTACGLCADICFMHAMKIAPRGRLADVIGREPIELMKRGTDRHALDTWEDKLSGMFSGPVYRT